MSDSQSIGNFPAFPIPGDHGENPFAWGLSARELFAAMAMQQLLSPVHGCRMTPEQCSVWSVIYADRLLEELAKPSFMVETGLELRNAAFIESDDGFSGCSPDGLVGDNLGVTYNYGDATLPVRLIEVSSRAWCLKSD